MGWAALIVALILLGKKEVSNLMIDKKSGIQRLAEAALPVSQQTGIPIAYIVTQAAHESAYGSSKLSTASNNLFGIKAAGSWKGPADDYPTNEFIDGKTVVVHAYFRKYDSWEDSVRDWAVLIQTRYPRAYAAALAHDSANFFKELQAGGYATDPHYSTELAGVYNDIKELVA